jgi:hypothetical protein
MTKISELIGVPLPKLPSGYRWQTLGRWTDYCNAGTLPEIHLQAYPDLIFQLQQLQKSAPRTPDNEESKL